MSPTLLLPEFPELFEVPLIPVICADKAQQGQVSRFFPIRSALYSTLVFSSKLFFFPRSRPRSVACDFASCHVQHMLEFFLYVKTAKNILLPQILAAFVF